jgi:hypothetical protein
MMGAIAWTVHGEVSIPFGYRRRPAIRSATERTPFSHRGASLAALYFRSCAAGKRWSLTRSVRKLAGSLRVLCFLYGHWNARPKPGPDTNLYNRFVGFRFG